MITPEEQAAWDDIRTNMKAMMPGLSDADVVLCTRLLAHQLFGIEPGVDALYQEHLASPGPHDLTCSACGYFDAARYTQRTGRMLSHDMAKAGKPQ